MIEFVLLAASVGLAALAAAGEVKEIHGEYQSFTAKQKQVEDQLAWEAKEAKLVEIERAELEAKQTHRLLTDQNASPMNLRLVEEELKGLHLQKMVLKAKELPEY